MMNVPGYRPKNVKVTFRKMRFDFERTGFAPHWHRGPFISHFWNALSQAFIPGEKFFIESVRRMRDVVDDAALVEEMEEFVRQEAQHTLQHRKFNSALAAMGYDVERLEKRYAWALDIAARFVDAKGMLEVTMALEHFTAGFAHEYFRNPDIGRGADPNVEALWAWHAAEEAEHKATAFDVYAKLGGGYFGRVRTLAPSWAMIIAITLVNVADLLYQDGKPVDPKDLADGLGYLFGRRGLFTRMVPSFFDFFRPSFQPWDQDDSADLEQWEKNASAYLVQKGRGPARRSAETPAAAVA
jgi:predicted metal-dependent hydrolase